MSALLSASSSCADGPVASRCGERFVVVERFVGDANGPVVCAFLTVSNAADVALSFASAALRAEAAALSPASASTLRAARGGAVRPRGARAFLRRLRAGREILALDPQELLLVVRFLFRRSSLRLRVAGLRQGRLETFRVRPRAVELRRELLYLVIEFHRLFREFGVGDARAVLECGHRLPHAVVPGAQFRDSLAQRAALLGEFGRATREFGVRFGLVTLERRVGGRGVGSGLGQLLVRGA